MWAAFMASIKVFDTFYNLGLKLAAVFSIFRHIKM